MSPAELLVPFALAGFHIAITLFALYRARIAWIRSTVEQRADRRTLWRLAFLRFVAVIVALSGGALAFATPLLVLSSLGATFLPTTAAGMGAIICGAWFVWIPSTITLDNLAIRWLKNRRP